MAKRRGLALDGVLLLDKPVGLSSNHALQRAKRAMDAAKAGHTGTLDPFATGLLVCCMGRATKISGFRRWLNDAGLRSTVCCCSTNP
jgi:tRNA pseudouridine55 synthase